MASGSESRLGWQNCKSSLRGKGLSSEAWTVSTPEVVPRSRLVRDFPPGIWKHIWNLNEPHGKYGYWMIWIDMGVIFDMGPVHAGYQLIPSQVQGGDGSSNGSSMELCGLVDGLTTRKEHIRGLKNDNVINFYILLPSFTNFYLS